MCKCICRRELRGGEVWSDSMELRCCVFDCDVLIFMCMSSVGVRISRLCVCHMFATYIQHIRASRSVYVCVCSMNVFVWRTVSGSCTRNSPPPPPITNHSLCVYMSISICVQVYVHVCACMHARGGEGSRARMCICVCLCICTPVRMFLSLSICPCVLNMYSYTYAPSTDLCKCALVWTYSLTYFLSLARAICLPHALSNKQ